MADDSLNSRRPAGRSPFDSIRHTDTDPERGEFEWWTAREAMALLGYMSWENMQNVLAKAKKACRNSGRSVADNFRDITKNSTQVGRPQGDTHLSRFGMYLVAMNGDPDKPQIAAAQQYFAIQTYRAEQSLPSPLADIPLVKASSLLVPERNEVPRPWYVRVRLTWTPHMRIVRRDFPGHFTAPSELAMQVMTMEDELHFHEMTTRAGDRPDVSVGLRWAKDRRSRGLQNAESEAPLFLAEQDMEVMVRLYPEGELPAFRRWFWDTYMPECYVAYLDGKKEYKVFHPVTRASAAEATCLEITGRPANLKAAVRAALQAAGGVVPASKAIGPRKPPNLPPASSR